MRNILSPRNLRVLEGFASGKVLLAFDYDGTLVPLRAHPSEVSMNRSTRRLLRDVARTFPMIVVSGRSRADVQRRMRGIALEEVVGNHGIEPLGATRGAALAVERWLPKLSLGVRPLQGVVLENKRFSLCLHFRKSRDKSAVKKALALLVKSVPGARAVAGKQVVNIVLHNAPDKGRAVELERKRLHLDKVIYVGDDVTDESAFALSKNGDALGIRVGHSTASRARFYIRNQKDIDRLLVQLLAIRKSVGARGPA